MLFIETPIFTKKVTELVSDKSYKEFQEQLGAAPKMGAVIKGSNGIRKVRWNMSGAGKSSGVRVIYYFLDEAHHIYLLTVFPKSKKDTLSKEEVKKLSYIPARIKEAYYGQK